MVIWNAAAHTGPVLLIYDLVKKAKSVRASKKQWHTALTQSVAVAIPLKDQKLGRN